MVNTNVVRQIAGLTVNLITISNFAAIFNCKDLSADSMKVPT